MKSGTSEYWLPVYEALASKVRLRVIELLSEKPMNIKELAGELNLSSAVMTSHVKKLEKAGIIDARKIPGKSGVQKLCSLAIDRLEISFPIAGKKDRRFHQVTIPIGHYTDFEIEPTCGLATTKKLIGYFDDPRYFMDSDRVDAKILWFSSGFVEYKIPNYLLSSQTLEELEIFIELGSEAPGYNNEWPSDIAFYLNGVHLGIWTSPGDFGGTRGRYTPEWWADSLNQYGLLKSIRMNSTGSYVDGMKISNATSKDIDHASKYWTLRIASTEGSKHNGGVTIFGEGFGNYNQDIIFRVYYH